MTKEPEDIFEETLEVDKLNLSHEYLQYLITQFNDGIKNNSTSILVGSEYEDDTKVDFMVEAEQYSSFLNLLFDHCIEIGYYMYLTIIIDMMERIKNNKEYIKILN